MKIYAKKKHEVPGPQAYITTPKWIYDKVNAKKCKFLPTDRVTSTEMIIKDAKRAKTPGPNAYKAKHSYSSKEARVIGTIKSNQDQLQMFNDKAAHSKGVPGHKYKKNYVSRFHMKNNRRNVQNSVDPKERAFLYFPRTKPEGSGPGLKRLEKDKSCGPGQYDVKYHLTEKN